MLDRFGLFDNIFGHFGWFRVVTAGFGSFWLFPGFSKYGKFLHGLQIISFMDPKIWDLAPNKLTQVLSMARM